ncbi:MAG: hypothetical protein PHV71_01235 [Eubacteriales bacterium]|nr:hypothetical protein [Eubacteriales bacterium]MDD3199374.1 hypothetical protein [Eubacteriales bacterium]MDD4121626.1 hypothetical protein [Eubacteriales bacterium]MDD4629208.1 hypothetical protein [Eubacteriales bacterium]
MKEQDFLYLKIHSINRENPIIAVNLKDGLSNNKCKNVTPMAKENIKKYNKERDVSIKMTEELFLNDKKVSVLQTPTCATGLDPNCSECCAIFTNADRRSAFGYQLTNAACECHDICVEDVRDICVDNRTIRHCIPCNTDGSAGCRGGFLPDGPPTVQSWRVRCAEERLSPATGCDRIINEIEFEVTLRYGNTLVVVTPRDIFECFYYEFARFPSGTFYANNQTGLNDFRNELALIDGSCKVILIGTPTVVTDGNDCILVIPYRAIDKLWKHENLLVSAIKPYANVNLTVKQEFAQGHAIVPCTGSGPCAGLLAGI